MAPLNLLKPVLGMLLVVNLVTAMQQDFEFGKQTLTPDKLIYENHGILLQDSLHIPQLLGSYYTYVKLTLWSDVVLTAKYDWQSGDFDIGSDAHIIKPAVFNVQAYGVVMLPPNKKSQ